MNFLDHSIPLNDVPELLKMNCIVENTADAHGERSSIVNLMNGERKLEELRSKAVDRWKNQKRVQSA